MLIQIKLTIEYLVISFWRRYTQPELYYLSSYLLTLHEKVNYSPHGCKLTKSQKINSYMTTSHHIVAKWTFCLATHHAIRGERNVAYCRVEIFFAVHCWEDAFCSQKGLYKLSDRCSGNGCSRCEGWSLYRRGIRLVSHCRLITRCAMGGVTICDNSKSPIMAATRRGLCQLCHTFLIIHTD